MTTLRPFGPSVAFTASAMMLTPLSSELRASSSNLSCFGMDRVPPYSRMARTSSSRRMRYSLSSILTSEPEYLLNRILSPAFTSSGIFLPSSPTFPVPAAIALPSCGFSLAVSGMMIPPRRTSCSSSRSTRMRSCSGRIFMVSLPPWCFVDVALASSGDGVTILQCRLPVSTQFQRVLNIRSSWPAARGKSIGRGRMAKSILVSNVLPAEALGIIPREVTVDYNDTEAGLSKTELIARLRGKDGLICHIISKIDDEVLAAAPTVKVVANVAVGYNNIDVVAARRRGVVVTNTPDVLTETTADFAWALLMATARRVVEADHFARSGQWRPWHG